MELKTNQLDIVADLRDSLLADNSANYKKNVLDDFVKKYKNDTDVMNVLDMIFNQDKYLLTSKIFKDCDKEDTRLFEVEPSDRTAVNKVLCELKSSGVSSQVKKRMLIDLYITLDHRAAEVLECILDKDLKCGVSTSAYKTFINTKETLGVSLANKYFEKKKKVDFEKDSWYMSRKLDGCRLNIVKEGDSVKALSRTGKEYTTLDVLTKVFANIPGDFVLDGEVITKSGMEHDDFKSIVSQIKRKGYTVPDPVMMVFDFYSIDNAYGRTQSAVFSERYDGLQLFFNRYRDLFGDSVVLVEQTKVENEEHLMAEFNKAGESGWEGLMIRKDVAWEGKRTDNLLKLKAFDDGEFKIIGYTLGDFRYKNTVLHDVLASVDIDYKGYNCSVGSGWSLDERKKYAEDPEALIGRILKVKYFEETTNDKGELSLRFPIKVFLYDTERFD